ncbi:hypothetical protein B0H11DRAFT_2276067, partial [Mycena galericulata]
VVNAHGPRTCIFFLDLFPTRPAASSARSHCLSAWSSAVLGSGCLFDFNTPTLRRVRASGVVERCVRGHCAAHTPFRRTHCDARDAGRRCAETSVWAALGHAAHPQSRAFFWPGLVASRSRRKTRRRHHRELRAAAERVHRAGHDVLPPPLACLGGIELVQAAHAPAGGRDGPTGLLRTQYHRHV